MITHNHKTDYNYPRSAVYLALWNSAEQSKPLLSPGLGAARAANVWVIAQPINVGQYASFGECSIINPNFIGFKKTSS